MTKQSVMPKLLHDMIDHAAKADPQKVAFRCLEEEITYGELARKSGQLAQLLITAGVSPGDRVGLYLNKSLETAVGLFGIMKAGAAFVPIDSSVPTNRAKTMIDHCGIRHLVSNKNMRGKVTALLPLCPKIECVVGLSEGPVGGCHFHSWDEVENQSHAKAIDLDETDIAYIMYTSGSTGNPKGITHTHSSGIAYVRKITEVYDVSSSDVFGNHAPLHFDISLFDYFGAPFCGATTVIIPEPYMRLPASLSQLMQDEKITLWFSVPNALTNLLLYGVLDKRDLSSLRWVLFGGEPFPIKHLRELMHRWPATRFSNVYGPAEVNACSYHHVDEYLSDGVEAIPIGLVWDIADGLIVDENDNAVKPGDIGELLICAPTRMNGYWQAPELNQNCFFERTGLEGEKSVFYRTGDLVSQLTGAPMMFHGRKDRQIKLRGYRVELDEVEFALSEHEAVEEAGVYLAQDGEAIEAAVTLMDGSAVDEKEVLRLAASRLPTYAVPQRVRILNYFPRTGSDKIDRTALRAMFSSSQSGEQ